MKYVIFKDDKSPLLSVVLTADSTTHSQLNVEGATAKTAGFFDVKNLKTYGFSESLNLYPKPTDADYIVRALIDFGTNGFIDMEGNYSNPQMKPLT
jgi:hypothetical protein